MLTLLRMLRNIPERKLVRLFVFPVMAVRSQSCRQQDTSHTSKGFQKSHETKYYTQFSFILANFVNSPRVITVNPTSVDDNDGIAGTFEIILELSKSSTRLTSTQLRFHSPWKLPPPPPLEGRRDCFWQPRSHFPCKSGRKKHWSEVLCLSWPN